VTEPIRSSRAAQPEPANGPEVDPAVPEGEDWAEERSTPGGSRHLRVVEPRSRRRRPNGRFLFLAASGVVIAVAFGLVYLHVVMAQRQIRLDDLNAQVAKDQAQYQTLRLQVAQLSSPQQIISTAEGKLGMRQPQSVIYLTPKSGSASAGPSGLGSDPPTTKGGVVPAPEGDADWPAIKSDLAGSP
jgi:cell division protein FtsL